MRSLQICFSQGQKISPLNSEWFYRRFPIWVEGGNKTFTFVWLAQKSASWRMDETFWNKMEKFIEVSSKSHTKSFLIKFVILQVVFSFYIAWNITNTWASEGNIFEEQRNIQKQFTKYLVILLLLYLMGQCLRRNWGFIQNKKRKLQSNLLSIFIVWKNYYSPSFQQMNKTFHYSKVWKCAAKYLSTSVALQFSSVHLTRKQGGATAFLHLNVNGEPSPLASLHVIKISNIKWRPIFIV